MLRSRTAVAAAIAAAALPLAAAWPAAAQTFPVAGTQTVVDAEAGTSTMQGGLQGDWRITSFKRTGHPRYFAARGTERFDGCLDRGGDGSCAGDPKGTLSLRFRYWALFGSEDPSSLVWGACWHPVVRGTGGFAGAQGVIVMADTPTPQGVSTAYVGSITLPSAQARRSRTARAATALPSRRLCGAAR